MVEHTHKCIVCHKKYSHCDKCKQINSWKAICCSVECYQKYIAPVIKEVDKIIEDHKEEVRHKTEPHVKKMEQRQMAKKYK